jgi:uncharacterized protein YecE (DUF72 family)
MDQHGWVILVGCCGWSERRDAYVAEFPVVELQHTFYQLPNERLAERWRSSVPPGFEFAIKAWQAITHRAASPTYRRLREHWPATPSATAPFSRRPTAVRAPKRLVSPTTDTAVDVIVRSVDQEGCY